jgi:hypothetical protein
MKRILTILCLLMAVCNLSAQDKIVKINGDTILAKVQAITSNEISYKKYNNQQGPVYTMERREVAQIIYENNTVESFSPGASKSKNSDLKGKNKLYGNNIISLQPAKIFGSKNNVYTGGGGYIERILLRGYLGIKVGAFMAYDLTMAAFSYEAKFYPTGQGKLKYYIGAGGKSGLFYFNTIQEQDGDAMNAFQLINGFYYQISPHFMVGLNTGIGMGFQNTKVMYQWNYKMEQVPFTAYNAGIVAGVRF